ncbi:hypothetical protein CEXT_444031 [Caerostris extrusa]|uniref:Uncharacterized protein n=1 Tax=Caerostris extrusa TaxID=172846 RepID=A0AAV4SMX8_CAEEX|nr:hypothetical protein CEXT_444031 [Caerostris extrusa]
MDGLKISSLLWGPMCPHQGTPPQAFGSQEISSFSTPPSGTENHFCGMEGCQRVCCLYVSPCHNITVNGLKVYQRMHVTFSTCCVNVYCRGMEHSLHWPMRLRGA